MHYEQTLLADAPIIDENEYAGDHGSTRAPCTVAQIGEVVCTVLLAHAVQRRERIAYTAKGLGWRNNRAQSGVMQYIASLRRTSDDAKQDERNGRRPEAKLRDEVGDR